MTWNESDEKSIAAPPIPRVNCSNRSASEPVTLRNWRSIRQAMNDESQPRPKSAAEPMPRNQRDSPSCLRSMVPNASHECLIPRVGTVVSVVEAAQILGADGDVDDRLRSDPGHQRRDLATVLQKDGIDPLRSLTVSSISSGMQSGGSPS